MSFTFSSSPARMVTLVVAMMAVLVEPHMIMATPKPYGNPDNSPLTSNNYPCKVTSDPATFYKTDGIIDQNSMVAGEKQSLSFSGSAVHGGGSCQLAITSDMQPSANTSWRVLLSIESGCPSKDGSGPSTYDWTLPADLAPGHYSFAWTWISKLAGQPEYYMNCAPISVTAAKAKRDTEGVSLIPRADTYPEIFVGNLADINSCKSSPSSDPLYPDPGQNVEKLLEGASPAFSSISGSGCVPVGQTEGPGPLPTATAGDTGGAAAGTPPAASASATASSTDSNPAPGSPSGGVFATTGDGTTSSAAASTTLSTSTTTSQAGSVYVSPVPVGSATSASQNSGSATGSAASSTTSAITSDFATVSATSATKPAPSATLSPTSGSGSGSGSGNSTGSAGGGSSSGKSGPCTSEGMFNCIGSQYQQCASGAWTAMKALPGGTVCTQGESENLWARDAAAAPENRVRKLRWAGKRWVDRAA
ncbi:hypothetical protein KVR01_000236 [Diaporthe batatas]|uniref:uncharacterized protein n=1 Tax=Diaporthe batatas TaxID=748121 RepID=UPI001D055F24|nr:uncharacterized protein KVR01_000236 [Diaporthe batatas]KAG8169491.1 hypothetical protein KVR01_000236 [Diaporthe batatas]